MLLKVLFEWQTEQILIKLLFYVQFDLGLQCSACLFTVTWNSAHQSLALSSRHIGIFFLFFPENRFWHFMQIISSGDNLHEMPKPVSEKNKKNIINVLAAELVQRVVMLKVPSKILADYIIIFQRKDNSTFQLNSLLSRKKVIQNVVCCNCDWHFKG